MEQVYTPKNDYKVFVRCNTFNQSKYIEDALKGFAMQQTNFPFVCLVMDDCSTDGEQDVIKTWMEHVCDMDKAEYIEIELSHIILVPHKSNANCYFAFYLLKRNTWKERNLKVAMYTPWREHCQYEALCEGDDYWTDPHKIQIQANYLDAHPEVVYSCHRFKIFRELKNQFEDGWDIYFDKPDHQNDKMFIFDRDYPFQKKWITLSLTQMVRINCIDDNYIAKFKMGRDVHNIYNILSKGKGVCHSFVGGVYRINEGGIYGAKPPYEKNYVSYRIYKEFSSIEKDPMLRHLAHSTYLKYWKTSGRKFRIHFDELYDFIRLLGYLLFEKTIKPLMTK